MEHSATGRICGTTKEMFPHPKPNGHKQPPRTKKCPLLTDCPQLAKLFSSSFSSANNLCALCKAQGAGLIFDPSNL